MADKTTTYTLRLPEIWKSRLERTAIRKNITMNQLFSEIIGQFYGAAGFHDSNSITLKNGRKLELRITPVENHPPGTPTCWFSLVEPSENVEVACYQIGASNQLMLQFDVARKDEYDVVSELGKALLHFHNSDMNIAKLEWQQFPTQPEKRTLNLRDLKTKGNLGMSSQLDFHQALSSKDWVDKQLKTVISPVLSASVASVLQREIENYYDIQLKNNGPDAVDQLNLEKERAVELIKNLVPDGLHNLGLHDVLLNDKEVHIFSERWKPGHPKLEANRVIVEIGSSNADRAIAGFVYEYADDFLESRQPYVCRWIENGEEKSRPLTAP